MMYLNNPKLSLLIVIVSLLFAGCDNNLTELDPVNETKLEEELNLNGFDFSELVEMTDFTNMRQGDFTGRFLILSKGPNLPNNLARSIQNVGGEIVKTYPEIGVAVAVAKSRNFYAKAKRINGIESITPDIILQYIKDPETRGAELSLDNNMPRRSPESTSLGTPFNYQDAIFDGFQWAPASINAPAAWDAGVTGEGVRVAIIDTGIHSTHIDIAPNLDITSSISTVPGFNFNEDVGTFWHGTHVAGIVAAAGVGIVGIAPKATIIGVKSLHDGSGAWEWILDGVMYAATPQSNGGGGADIINMSLGTTINFRDNWKDPEFRIWFREFQKIWDRATRYAYQNGVTVIAAAGNGATNHDEAKELINIPAENHHVLSISATGPTGWVLGNTNFSQFAYYTDYGKSLVDFAAPGGTVGLWVVEGYDGICTLNGTYRTITNWCEVFDMVLSPVRGNSDSNYAFAQGTSMAAPAAAGVVALMMHVNGGNMSPAQVSSRLKQSSTDLGKPGNDEYYGHGFVNAAKASGIY